MKRRSVCLALSLALLVIDAGQADLASASQSASAINDAPISVGTGTWSAFAGADSNASGTGNAYSLNLASTTSIAPCPVVHWALYDATTAEKFQYSGTKVFVYYLDPNVMVGMPVSGPGIVPGNTLAKIDRSDGTIYLTMTLGANTTKQGGKLTFGIPSGFDGSSSAFNATTSPYPVDPEGPTWSDSSFGTNDVVRIQDTSKYAKLNVGMLVQEYVGGVIGSRISNSGINRIAEKLSDNRIRLTYGGNSTLRYGELLFNNFCPSSGSSGGRAFFTLKNSGTVDLKSMSIAQTGSALSGNTITWTTCGGTWNESNGTCSGSTTVILTTSSTSAQTLSLDLTTGDWVRVRAVSAPAGGGSALNVSVIVSTADFKFPHSNINQ